MQQTGINRLVAAGGVSANKQLREGLLSLCQNQAGQVFFPRPEFCTDNGAMIAYTGAIKLQQGKQQPLSFKGIPRWPLTELAQSDV